MPPNKLGVAVEPNRPPEDAPNAPASDVKEVTLMQVAVVALPTNIARALGLDRCTVR